MIAWKERIYDTIGLGILRPVENRLANARFISWKAVEFYWMKTLKFSTVRRQSSL